jgi:hypothetical protein
MIITGSIRGRAAIVAVALLLAAGPGSPARGQDDDRGGGWQKLESAAETRAFKEAMRAGGGFDAAAKGYLEETALPQLAAEGNRPTIAFIRRRIKDILLTEFGSEKTAEDANKTVLSFMEGVAAREDEAAVVRVNAVLMIGELQGQDRKPWGPAAPVLAKMAAAADAPAAQRIAALVGLARHVDAAKGNAAVLGRLAAVGAPAIDAILDQPAGPASAPEANWLVSRALSLLPVIGPASPQTVARVARVLGDEGRSIDARVRAATTLAVVAGKESKVDGPAAIRAIEEIAVAGLRADTAVAERIQIERLFTGGASAMMSPGSMSAPPPGMMPGMAPGMAPGMPGFGGPGMQPAVEQLIPREVCRRAAWRLVALADAVLSADGQKGLVLLPGADSPEARELSGKLRRGGLELDATPDDEHVKLALEELRPPPPPTDEEAEAGEEMADKPEPAGEDATAGDEKPAPAEPADPAPAKPAKPAKPSPKPAAGKP